MSRYPRETIKAVGEAFMAGDYINNQDDAVERAINVALDKLGLRVEAHAQNWNEQRNPAPLERLVSDWRPVDEEPDDGAGVGCEQCNWTGVAPDGENECEACYVELSPSVRIDSEPSEPLNVLRDLVEAHDAWSVNSYPSDGTSRHHAAAWFAEAEAVERVVERARSLVEAEAGPSATSEGAR